MKKYKAFRQLNMVITACILVLTSSCIFTKPSASKLFTQAQNFGTYDAIIVPGIPFDGLKGKWNTLMKMRVYWSVYLYKQGLAKNIIYSGSAVYTPYCESKIMALYAEALGVPKEHIFIDSSAEHSRENIYYSCYIASKLGFNSVAVATDPLQSLFLSNYPEKINADVKFLPIVYKTLFSMSMLDIDINPASAFVENFVSLTEREGFRKRFKGTRGKNVKMLYENLDIDTLYNIKTAANYVPYIIDTD